MTDKALKEIREKIACPQFGDDHYGEWGALTLQQRKTILKLLDYVKQVRLYTVWEVADKLKIRAGVIFQKDGISDGLCVSIREIDELIKEMESAINGEQTDKKG